MFNLEFIKVVKQIVIEDRDYLEHHLNFESWCTIEEEGCVEEYSADEVDEVIAAGCGTTFCLAGYLHYLFAQKDTRLSAFGGFDGLATNELGNFIYR